MSTKPLMSISGNTDHVHTPCPVCGYATRYKQFGPMRCFCNMYGEGKPGTPCDTADPCRLGELPDGKLTCLTHARDSEARTFQAGPMNIATTPATPGWI